MTNSINENFDNLALQCLMEATKLLRSERFNNFIYRITNQNDHLKGVDTVASDYRSQGIATLVTSVISATGNILGGLVGFGGSKGFGWWHNRTVDSIGKTLSGIAGAADAIGRTLNSFQEGGRYKDQAQVDRLRGLLDELNRMIDDQHQTSGSIRGCGESILSNQRDASRQIANLVS